MRTYFLLFILLIVFGLAGCGGGETAVSTPIATPAPTSLPTDPPPSTNTPSPTAVPTLVPTPSPSAPPATATPVFPPPNYFAAVTTFFQNEDGKTAVSGIVSGENGPKQVELLVPGNVRIFDGEYAPATNQILYTDRARAAGPGNLAAGPLHRLKMTNGQTDTLVDEGVVAFTWAPDGKAFAYILATEDTYQLRWRSADGEDLLLAVDAPRSLSVSPSGERVAFTRESGYAVGGDPGLYVVDVAGQEEGQIAALDRAGMGGSGPAWQPVWSPDESSLLLRTTGESGTQFVWAESNGRSHFTIPTTTLDEAVNAAWQEANPDSARSMCAAATVVLVNGRSLITGVSACPQFMDGPLPGSHLAVLAVDPEAETVTVEELLPLPNGPAHLLTWEIPGESVFVPGETVAVVQLPAPLSALPTTTAAIDPAVETSPDGLWQAAYGFSEPVDGGENGPIYRAYLSVQSTDGRRQWTAIDEWRPHGLGLDYPAPLQWSADGRYLYFTNRPLVDGCGLFANGSDLWRLDLSDGNYVQLVSFVGTSLALSPDGQTLAYASYGAGGPRQAILRNVATGAERFINLDYDLPADAGNLVWSPDGTRLLAAVAYNPCMPDWTHSIFLVDVGAETAVPLIDHDDRRLTTLAWTGPDTARLISTDGARWLLDINTGELTLEAE